MKVVRSNFIQLLQFERGTEFSFSSGSGDWAFKGTRRNYGGGNCRRLEQSQGSRYLQKAGKGLVPCTRPLDFAKL